MTRMNLLQELRRMRFEKAYGGWEERRLTQEEARLLGVCDRTCRRHVGRYEEDGLPDRRLSQISARRTPTDEVLNTGTRQVRSLLLR